MKEVKLIIKGNETVYTELIECDKVSKPDIVDYDISDETVIGRNYYKLTFKGGIKHLATNGKVEVYDNPVKTKSKEWAAI